jgi:ABC-type oligopeptide transport system substrate-binding subunit
MKQNTYLIGIACLLLSAGLADAGEKYPGVSVFGPTSLKYDFGQPFLYLEPGAPVAGTLKLATSPFNKLCPFGLTGKMGPVWGCWEVLATKSWDDDEPYALYGLLAKSFELADDKKSLVITLRPEARFSDGEPVTADDVVFSYDVLSDPGYPPGATAKWRDISKVEKLDKHRVKLHFKKWRRDLLISTLSYWQIYPKHIYGKPGVNLAKDFLLKNPIGSGPYMVESVTMGQEITMVRNPDYWGDKLPGGAPMARGFHNFKRVNYQVYFDDFSKLEAFKSGELSYVTNIRPDDFKRLGGDFFDRGLIVKEEVPWSRPAAMFCVSFNLRRPIWQDRELRKVINSLYDFDFMNKNFHYGTQDRIVSYFNNQAHLRANPGPAKGKERALLMELAKKYNTPEKDYVPRNAFVRGPYELGTTAPGKRIPIGERITAATQRLEQLGWKWDPKKQARVKNGTTLFLEILGTDPWPDLQHFVETLRQAGIRATYTKLSKMEMDDRIKNRRFDMTVGWYDGRNAPGRELAQNFLSKDANVKSSRNVMGLTNPAVDALLEVMMTTEDIEKLSVYSRVFDRVMSANWYVVPMSWTRVKSVAYWSYLQRPKIHCSGLEPIYIINSYWYADPERLKKVEHAMETGGRVNFPLRELLPNAGVKPPPVKASTPQKTTPKQGGTK